MWYVYRHVRVDKNTTFYIGIGQKANYLRAYSKSSRNVHWKSIVNKTNYKVEILFSDLTETQAKYLEMELIQFYGRKCDGGTLCNITAGGDGVTGLIWSEEHRRKLLLTRVGRKLSEEHKANIGKAGKGKKRRDITKFRTSENHVRSKLVLDITTGVYYTSISKAATAYNTKTSTLNLWLMGTRKNKSNLRLV